MFVTHLWRERVFRIAVGRVQIHSIAALEALQMRILEQVWTKSHVPTVNVGLPTAELEQDLRCPRTVIGINDSDLDSCPEKIFGYTFW